MSYILSALKKAEQERTDTTPLAASLLAAQTTADNGSGPRWLWVGLFPVSLLLLAVLAWFWLTAGVNEASSQQPVVPLASTQPIAPPPANVFPTQASNPQAVKQVPDYSQANLQHALPTQPATAIAANTSSKPELPDMDIGGHIYVEGRPVASRLFVDGQALRSGASLPNGVSVGEISANSVMLQYRGFTYSINVE